MEAGNIFDFDNGSYGDVSRVDEDKAQQPETMSNNAATNSERDNFGNRKVLEPPALDGNDDENDKHTISELERLQDTTSFVYWALLLEPVGEAKYKRVGIAMPYPHAFDVKNKKFEKIETV